ncbi:MAG: hypothetical protein ABGX16_16450, partial [Pirellulales bacterium]
MSDSVRKSGASRPPKYLRQKRKNKSDSAYIRIAGKKVMLGVYGSPESREKYSAIISGQVSV